MIETADNGVVKFAFNWNNKLNCHSFTTIRRHDPLKYAVGNVHQILMKTHDRWVTNYGRAKIVDVRALTLKQIGDNEFISRIDTGHSGSDTVCILKKIYRNASDDTLFSFVLYSKV